MLSSMAVSHKEWGDSFAEPYWEWCEYWKLMQHHGCLNVAISQFPSLLHSILLVKEIMPTPQCTKQPLKRMVRIFVRAIINCKLSHAGCLLWPKFYILSYSPNPLSPPKSHSYFNLDHCCHINAGTLSILYWLVGWNISASWPCMHCWNLAGS